MENPNRFEETEKKENPFVRGLKFFGKYLKSVGSDFVASFKYNNMKLASLLIAVPGVFLGFFLGFHSEVVTNLAFENGSDKGYYKISFNYAGIVLFILMLLGILNLFVAAQVSGKKNLGSVVTATVLTAGITICSAAYIYLIITYFQGYNDFAKALEKYGNREEAAKYGIAVDKPSFDSNYIMSVASIAISVVCPIAGCVLGFINYDRTYEKADR